MQIFFGYFFFKDIIDNAVNMDYNGREFVERSLSDESVM